MHNFYFHAPLYRFKFYNVQKLIKLLFVFFVPAMVLLLSNCRKEQFGKGSLSFSTDTLTFDTVFTSLGSTTKYFKVFNTDKKAIKISDLRLLHLTGNQFRINVDGVNGDHFSDIEIPAKDSIYVFVEVTVNPNSTTTPFVIIDDVQFQIGDASSTVHLQAFGQNAHYHYGEELRNGESKTWSNDLPHVIISHDSVPGVLVDCGATLTIRPGTKIFFAGNSALFVQGTLRAEATSWSDSIVFQGARLESFYEDKPGQWFGIVFLRNMDCVPQGFFDHCVINESTYGVYAGAGTDPLGPVYVGPDHRPQVIIKNTIIKNSSDNAVYGFNASIYAENSTFYAAGGNLVQLGLGGDYSFNHCTLYNTGSRFVDHKSETLLLSNLFIVNNTLAATEPLKTTFVNCVIYGSLQNEVSFNNYNDTNSFADFDNTFRYTYAKTKQDSFEMFTVVHDNMLYNEEPRFTDADGGSFTPAMDSTGNGNNSPLIDYAPTGLAFDIYGRSRPVSKTNKPNKYDIGAVETQ